MKMVKLSIIIVNHNSYLDLGNCLDSIEQHNDIDNNLEVIVVDNSNENDFKSYFYKNYPNVKMIKTENRGFGFSNNVGAKVSTSEYLLFLNPDTILVEPVFSFIIDKFEKNQKLGIFGVSIIDENNNRSVSFGTEHQDFISIIRYNYYFKRNKINNKNMHVSGANMMIRKKAFIESGMFDENLFLFREEADITRRIMEVGYNNDYFPERKIIHLMGTSTKSINRLKTIYSAYKYYCDKYNLNFKKRIKKEIRTNYLFKFYNTFNKNKKNKYDERIIFLKTILDKIN